MSDSTPAGDTGTALEVRRIMEAYSNPQIVELLEGTPDKCTVIVTKDSDGTQNIHDMKQFLDKWRDKPERVTGSTRLDTQLAFCNHVDRFKDDRTVLFADIDENATAAKISACYNYHNRDKPENLDHNAYYKFPLSEEWKFWIKQNGKAMNQEDFANFLEDGIVDIETPPQAGTQHEEIKRLGAMLDKMKARLADPTKMLELSKGLQINAHEKVKSRVNVDSGETQILFEHEHKDEAGEALTVPNMFLINIPIFEGENPVSLLVRLRYRVRAAEITWHYDIYKPIKCIKAAFHNECVKLSEALELHLFFGLPNTPRNF